jgi:hypothetical protein
LYFADNILLFLDASLNNIQASKWVFLDYEDILGMKINFVKCKLVSLNLLEDSTQLAEQLRYKLTNLPLMYLKIFLH